MRMILPLALALLLPVPAVAADETPPTSKVRYRDLDLRSETDVRRLRSRVREAAISVCAQSGFTRTGMLWPANARHCQDDAVATAEPRVQIAVAEARGTRLASVDMGEFTVGGSGGGR